MRWLALIAGSIAALVVIAVAIGYSLPVQHVASRSVALNAPPERVWETITDIRSMPEWRAGLESAEITGLTEAGPTWREVSGDGTITFETVESVPHRRLVTRIIDESLPFGGSWTYELEPAASGTQLTIREDGEVYNPVFRLVSRYVMGHHATIDKYLASLQTRLGSPR